MEPSAMTKFPDDGGPAFPMAVAAKPDGDTVSSHSYGVGMSLRDWFASHVLAGMLAKPSNADGMHDSYAEDAYRYADEMIRARVIPHSTK